MIGGKKTLRYDIRLKDCLYQIEDDGREMSILCKGAFLKTLS